MYCPQASDLDVYRPEGRNAMSRANTSATSGRTTNAAKGTEQRVGRAPRGAEKVTVPFPDAGADVSDSYEYTKLAEGQSLNSVRTHRSTALRLRRDASDKLKPGNYGDDQLIRCRGADEPSRGWARW